MAEAVKVVQGTLRVMLAGVENCPQVIVMRFPARGADLTRSVRTTLDDLLKRRSFSSNRVCSPLRQQRTCVVNEIAPFISAAGVSYSAHVATANAAI